jgi:antirestriction protein ArdC
MQNNKFQQITDSIIELLETHQANPDTPTRWINTDTLAYNSVSNYCYTGINQLFLSYVCNKQNRELNSWLTFNQIKALNGKIKKGSKGMQVIFTSHMYLTSKNVNITKMIQALIRDNKDVSKIDFVKKSFLKQYYVFNVADVENLPSKYYTSPVIDSLDDTDSITSIDELIYNTGAKINFLGNESFYNIKTDIITLPIPSKFHTSEDYYSVLFHELSHWTGAENRLNRNFNNDKYSYAFEEIIAELSASFLMFHFNLNSYIKTQANCIEFWIKAIKEDPKFIIKAASKAQEAFYFITNPKFKETTYAKNPSKIHSVEETKIKYTVNKKITAITLKQIDQIFKSDNLTKGQLISIAYNDNTTNIDTAVPHEYWDAMKNYGGTFWFVMDYQSGTAKIVHLGEKILGFESNWHEIFHEFVM